MIVDMITANFFMTNFFYRLLEPPDRLPPPDREGELLLDGLLKLLEGELLLEGLLKLLEGELLRDLEGVL
jgi:hypothetical protein